ncbi:protocatechuate 3,4-dioxygenase subunit alpha [Actinophytocola sp.]|uniref:protocatechuate 3,4-dioxygenase subunit alpha n=1 Tax=Actinophytocola sp. TaxID=1872138 RepID=UPI003D6BF093
MTRTPTPGQTIGPFFHDALPYDGGQELVPPGRPDAILLYGHVWDGDGDPVHDALLEIWQADAAGHISRSPGSLRRDGHTFTGWGRAATDNTGRYAFTTVWPGRVDVGRPPYIALTVFARGLLNRLFTRIYLPDDDHAADPLLAALPEERRRTLVATQDTAGLRFDVRMQGEGETVFLRYPEYP